MDGTSLAALIGSSATALGVLVTWLVSRRTNSGKVETSTASDLWAEGAEIRRLLAEEAKSRREENQALRQEAIDCHRTTDDLRRRINELETTVSALRSGASPLGGH